MTPSCLHSSCISTLDNSLPIQVPSVVNKDFPSANRKSDKTDLKIHKLTNYIESDLRKKKSRVGVHQCGTAKQHWDAY